MAEPTPPSTQGTAGGGGTPAPTISSQASSTAPTTKPASTPYKAPPTPASATATATASGTNQALRMMGIPGLPKKLPSRNWMIFWAVLGTCTGAVVYDKREKKRATARWSRAVSRLAREPLPGPPTQMPRRLTIYLECPPGDGLRVAQDHFTEYVKPVLAASGLDWEFVQGRKEGDVRAAVAERIRRARQPASSSSGGGGGGNKEEAELKTTEEIIRETRTRNDTPEWPGVKGDIVVGRHTWKEYVRGLHEGWLGPLTAPVLPEPIPAIQKDEDKKTGEEDSAGPKPAEEKEKKPERPPQPPPYNSPNDYPTSSLPAMIPAELHPSAPLQFPHLLGFSGTLTRLRRFLNRRHLADDIGREVAAVCFAAAREYRDEAGGSSEIEAALEHEERDWPKSVWKEEKQEEQKKKPEEGEEAQASSSKPPPPPPPEKIWASPVVVDPRIGMRMRRFEIRPEDEEGARAIVVPEEDVEGWIKGSLRGFWRWATAKPEPRPNWADFTDE